MGEELSSVNKISADREAKRKEIEASIFGFFYSSIYHMEEDQGWAMGDMLQQEFGDDELAQQVMSGDAYSRSEELVFDVHTEIMKCLDELKKKYSRT